MAKELAAIATVPRGATIAVEMICAVVSMTFSDATGAAMQSIVHSCGRLKRRCSPFCKRSTGLRRRTKYNRYSPTTSSARPVPSAAPAVPSPAPGRANEPSRTVPEGKINRVLNTISNAHMTTMQIPGVRILPVACSWPAATLSSWRAGRNRLYTKK